MKKITLFSLIAFVTSTLYAQTGTEIFQSKCVACHMLKPMMDKTKMKAMNQEDRMAMKEKMMKNMKAPPMNKVSAKLKHDFKNDKNTFTAFVKEYIVHPSKEKAHCMPMAIERFGLMPAIGQGMSAKDLNTISNWLYDNFTDDWDKSEMSKMSCGTSHKNGKCGGAMKKSNMKKCSAGKCSTGKCGGK